jgi:hypothetical protein
LGAEAARGEALLNGGGSTGSPHAFRPACTGSSTKCRPSRLPAIAAGAAKQLAGAAKQLHTHASRQALAAWRWWAIARRSRGCWRTSGQRQPWRRGTRTPACPASAGAEQQRRRHAMRHSLSWAGAPRRGRGAHAWAPRAPQGAEARALLAHHSPCCPGTALHCHACRQGVGNPRAARWWWCCSPRRTASWCPAAR